MSRRFKIIVEIDDNLDGEAFSEKTRHHPSVMEVEHEQEQVKQQDCSEAIYIARDIVESIASDVIRSFEETPLERLRSQVQKAHVPQPISQIVQFNSFEVFRRIPFRHFFTDEPSELLHVKVLKQFVPNFCGFHASFNMLDMLNSLKHSQPLRIFSEASFWRFKNETTRQISGYQQRYHPKIDKFPWREKDIKHGDFERTYLKICLEGDQRFITGLSSTDNVHVMFSTWEYQFGRVVHGENIQRDLQNKINAFIAFKKKNEACVLAVMMGVTNHWTTLLAQKLNGKVEFVFLDSRNRDYLQQNEEEIVQARGEEEKRRSLMGLKEWTDFDRLVQKTCVHDLQESLSILCECLIGNMTLKDCETNCLFVNFEKAYADKVGYNAVSEKKFEHDPKVMRAVEEYSKDFFHSIQGFFRVANALKFLTQANLEKFAHFKASFAEIFAYNQRLNPTTHHKSYIDPLHNLLQKASQ